MVLKGETVATGASDRCVDCDVVLEIGVYSSMAGYYIGYFCDYCGPHSRESGYYRTREDAQRALESGVFGR